MQRITGLFIFVFLSGFLRKLNDKQLYQCPQSNRELRMSEPVINFFHGGRMSLWTKVCILSFVRKGFRVQVWACEQLPPLPGVITRDARQLYPEDFRLQLTQRGRAGCWSSFSNFFRYKLLSMYPGQWYCDTDVFCLGTPDDYHELAHPHHLVACRESPSIINGAVLFNPDPALGQTLVAEAEEFGAFVNWTFEWGDMGPRFLTRFIARHQPLVEILDREIFYPITPQAFASLLLPEKRGSAEAACSHAKGLHYWNEIVKRKNIPTQLLPPEGSLLHSLFINAFPELKNQPCMRLRSTVSV
jgi:hypothetical protein